MLINGILWSIGMEAKIKGDLKIDFVGPYKPSTFRGGGHVKGVKPADLVGFDSPIMPKPTATPEKKKKKQAASKKKTAE